MYKKEVLKYFGKIEGKKTGVLARVGRLCGVGRQAVNNWHDIIPFKHAMTLDAIMNGKSDFKLRRKLIEKYGPCKLKFDVNLYRGSK